ncbi:MAG: L-2-amino-thiazoline-4-carboxylic acid hydrolase [Oscillospiraceae bacterium]|nr:L-2-amino-thiazoline-4-carboxylic acid hydrolase [Oscillospiraceae bacterium]
MKFYFSMVDLNIPKGKPANQKNILRYVKWYAPERERQYPNSFQVDFTGKPYEGACYYRITRCPICAYCKKLGVEELMPLLCELDNVMIGLQHGVLHRQQTIASDGPYRDYYITDNREQKKREN